MRRVLLVLPIAALAWAQGAPDLVQQGDDLYHKTCATGYCHAPKGGPGGGAPRLAARGFDEAYINSTITRGLPGTAMPAFGTVLQRRELTAVIAYVASLNGVTSTAPNFGGGRGGPQEPPLSGEAIRGRDFFHDSVRGFARCATCHQVSGMGIPVASPIAKVPANVPALRALATPQVQTAVVDGDTMPALVLSRGKQRTVFYDLTTAPPVRRTVDSATAKISDGSPWRHASVIGSYGDAELESILSFLRTVVKP